MIPLIALIGLSQIYAQTLPQPAFDAASIKSNVTDRAASSLNRSGGRLNFDNTSLRDCIQFAFDIPTGRDYELSGPAWLDSERFDIAATFPSDASRQQVRTMLRNLLAARFALATHTEIRNLPAYAITIARSGPKMKANTTGVEGAFIFGEDNITGRALSMSYLADRLSSPTFSLDRPVVDETSLSGAWDFTFRWAPSVTKADTEPGPSVFTSLEEQLGLKLVPRNVPFPVLIVDHMDRQPTEN